MADSDLDLPHMDGIKPAYAGLTADWSLGLREVTATIMDLALRGVLYVQGDRISVVGNTDSLAGFEKRLLDAIFQGSESATYGQIRDVYSHSHKALVKIICDGALEEGIIRPDFQSILAEKVRKSLGEVLGPIPRIPDNAVRLNAPTWLLSALKPLMPPLGEIEEKLRENAGGSCEDLILTEKGKRQRETSKKMKRILQKYTLTEERLADEYVAYTIAFGLKDAWLKRLGGRNAELTVLIERIDAENTITNFMDMDKYLAEIFNPP